MTSIYSEKILWELENISYNFKGNKRQRVIQAEKQFLQRIKEILKEHRQYVINKIGDND